MSSPSLEMSQRFSISNKQQSAMLQKMGVTVYKSNTHFDVTNASWLSDICELLNIALSDCIFDAVAPSFNYNTQKLHLPSSTLNTEVAIKKVIWQEISPVVASL